MTPEKTIKDHEEEIDEQIEDIKKQILWATLGIVSLVCAFDSSGGISYTAMAVSVFSLIGVIALALP